MKFFALPVLLVVMSGMTACVSDSTPDSQSAASAATTAESTSTQMSSSEIDSNDTQTDNTDEVVSNNITQNENVAEVNNTSDTQNESQPPATVTTSVAPPTEEPATSTETTPPAETNTNTEATSGEETTSTTETSLTTEETSINTEEETVAAQSEIQPWLRIPLHYKILLGQPHIWEEAGETLSLRLAQPALAESTTIELNSTENLVSQQLISYLGSDDEYYSAQIQNIENKTLILTTPLKQDIKSGANAWNFYSDGSHPNPFGYQVIADYAVRFLGKDKLNTGVHVLLGDSWFDDVSIFERLKHHLPAASIINQGIGGNTAANLLARFDEDVLPHTPNFVWILTGTNDYWQDVSASTYKANIDSLINKIKEANAVPIVFDSSVGPLNSGFDTITVLSNSYVTAIDELLAESELNN